MRACARFFSIFAMASCLLSAQSSDAQFYTVEKEIALGKQLAGETRKSTTPLENPAVQEYAERIGKRLSSQMDTPFSWSFQVVAGLPVNPIHEPLEYPGGFLFIPADLVLAAHDEDEFAGMLAHSIAHVANRDTTRAASFRQLSNQGTIPLVFVGGWQNGLALPRAYWAQARSFEDAADAAAVGMMKRAGYDPHALVRYLARVQPETTRGESPYPQRNTRLAALEASIQGLGGNDFVTVQEQVRKRVSDPPARKVPSLFR